MTRYVHEIRDPVHNFIRLDNADRKVLNSRPFQRLRHIHQLATSWLVYPGATHKRFEHSLGVMELAGRFYDVITHPANVSDDVRNVLEPLSSDREKTYWRQVVRMAALCHDIGHLPFSHAAERELLPEGWDHERLTRALVSSAEMMEIWTSFRPSLAHDDIVKLALGPKKARDLEFTDWEEILAQIIVGDAFGADRMDYLLRDSHHAGVAYGKFDHHRLVDTLRILPAAEDKGKANSEQPTLGMEEGGIQSAEALMFARYFMYSQVYYHRVRRICDIHLKDFLKEWLDGGRFSTDIEKHLEITDNEINDALWKAAFDESRPGHVHARRIVRREHFKTIYEQNPKDMEINLDAGALVYRSLVEKYGTEEIFRRDRLEQRSSSAPDFPVKLRDGRIVSSISASEAMKTAPSITFDNIFADRSIATEAQSWVERNRDDIIVAPEPE